MGSSLMSNGLHPSTPTQVLSVDLTPHELRQHAQHPLGLGSMPKPRCWAHAEHLIGSDAMLEPTFWASLGVKVGLGHVFKSKDISKYLWAQCMSQPMLSRTLWPRPVYLFISLILCRRFLSLNNINVRDDYTSLIHV